MLSVSSGSEFSAKLDSLNDKLFSESIASICSVCESEAVDSSSNKSDSPDKSNSTSALGDVVNEDSSNTSNSVSLMGSAVKLTGAFSVLSSIKISYKSTSSTSSAAAWTV